MRLRPFCRARRNPADRPTLPFCCRPVHPQKVVENEKLFHRTIATDPGTCHSSTPPCRATAASGAPGDFLTHLLWRKSQAKTVRHLKKRTLSDYFRRGKAELW